LRLLLLAVPYQLPVQTHFHMDLVGVGVAEMLRAEMVPLGAL
jgi:hypothetical protein